MSGDIVSQMKPQDQIIYLLGQIQGELKAVHATIDAQNSRQAAINATVAADAADMRRTVIEHGEELAVLKASTAPRLSWPQIVTGLAAVGALIIASSTLFPNI